MTTNSDTVVNRIQTNTSRSEDGQYMVEFALTLTVFIMFMLVVIDMGLMIYNHNLFYHAVYRGARQASLGASNRDIENTVEQYAARNYVPTLTMIAHPQEGVEISPDGEIDRVQGTSVEVTMDTTFGFSLLGFYEVTVDVPVRSEELISRQNDRDRDGLKDGEEPEPDDHDNDGLRDEYNFNGPDPDADGDGADDSFDTVVIGYFENASVSCPAVVPAGVSCISTTYSGYAILRPNDPNTVIACNIFSWQSLTWQSNPCFDGDYHAPEIWDNGGENPPRLFARELPTWHVDNTSEVAFTRTLNAAHDRDNDGWIDKHDEFPNDPTDH